MIADRRRGLEVVLKEEAAFFCCQHWVRNADAKWRSCGRSVWSQTRGISWVIPYYVEGNFPMGKNSVEGREEISGWIPWELEQTSFRCYSEPPGWKRSLGTSALQSAIWILSHENYRVIWVDLIFECSISFSTLEIQALNKPRTSPSNQPSHEFATKSSSTDCYM